MWEQRLKSTTITEINLWEPAIIQHHQLLIFFALLIFTFGLFSRIAERTSIAGPMFFMTIGILASPLAFGFISASPDVGAVRLVVELALALVLFIDASMIDKNVLLKAPSRIPARR